MLSYKMRPSMRDFVRCVRVMQRAYTNRRLINDNERHRLDGLACSEHHGIKENQPNLRLRRRCHKYTARTFCFFYCEQNTEFSLPSHSLIKVI